MATSTTAFEQRQNYPHVLSGLAHLDNNTDTTLPIPCGGRSVVRLGFPTGTDGTTATFLVQPFPPADPAAPTADPPFRTLVDRTGAAVSITVTDDSLVEIPQLSGCFAFQVVMGTAQSPAADIEVQCVGASPVPFEEADGGVVPSDFAAPAFTLGTSNVAGSSGKVVASDSTILVYDATAAGALANPTTATAGNTSTAAHRNHLHGIPTPGTVSTITSGASPGNGAGTGFATDTHIHGVPTLANAPTLKYKSASQTVSASTSFVNVTATSGDFAFAIGASEVWEVEFVLNLTFTGTGGGKFQLTGPASPTRVTAFAYPPLNSSDSPTNTNGTPIAVVSDGTAFSTTFAAYGSAATTLNNYTTAAAGGMRIVVLVANGTTAGTVTLQYAQNGANGTAVIGAGSLMNAVRVA